MARGFFSCLIISGFGHDAVIAPHVQSREIEKEIMTARGV